MGTLNSRVDDGHGFTVLSTRGFSQALFLIPRRRIEIAGFVELVEMLRT
jgi:hypothetical protein